MSIREELEKLKDNLIQQRDELRLKAGLAKLEVRDEWDQVEGKVEHFMGRMEAIGSETAHDVIDRAYEKIRKQL